MRLAMFGNIYDVFHRFREEKEFPKIQNGEFPGGNNLC